MSIVSLFNSGPTGVLDEYELLFENPDANVPNMNYTAVFSISRIPEVYLHMLCIEYITDENGTVKTAYIPTNLLEDEYRLSIGAEPIIHQPAYRNVTLQSVTSNDDDSRTYTLYFSNRYYSSTTDGHALSVMSSQITGNPYRIYGIR